MIWYIYYWYTFNHPSLHLATRMKTNIYAVVSETQNYNKLNMFKNALQSSVQIRNKSPKSLHTYLRKALNHRVGEGLGGLLMIHGMVNC